MKPAIVVVGYNRTDTLKRLLQSVGNAIYHDSDINLIISLDKAENEEDVINVADDFEWKYGKKIIRRFSERQGLRKHIIQCGDLTEKYGAVIVLEDDLLVAPDFYEYVKAALDYYNNDKCITGIALYSHEWNGYARKNFVPMADQYDTYLGQYSITWGQCWNYKWWKQFKMWYLAHEGKLTQNPKIPMNINHWSDKSWGKYFVNYIVEKDKYYVIPRISRSTNCSDVGEHVRIADNVHQVRLMTGCVDVYHFAPVGVAQKYDIYFENINIKEAFDEEIRDDLVIDLAGYGRKEEGKRFLLSTLFLPYKMIQSYGLQLRPYEMNVFHHVPGKCIFLYDTFVTNQVKKVKSQDVMRYEIRGFSVRDLIPYVKYLFDESVRNKIKRRGK